jgi:hypothetical protein
VPSPLQYFYLVAVGVLDEEKTREQLIAALEFFDG